MLIKTHLIFEVKVKVLRGKYKNIFQTIVFRKQLKRNIFYYKVVVVNIIQFFKNWSQFSVTVFSKQLKTATEN